MNGNMTIIHASQLITCGGKTAKKGRVMNDLGIIEDGAVRVEDGVIRAVGTTREVTGEFTASDETFDASGRIVLPGFVDPHTHFVFAGYRPEEFLMRTRGTPYMEIMAKGGGILNTVAATRRASREELFQSAVERLDAMLAYGVTTVEGKSGYGLDRDTEIKQLTVMRSVNDSHPMDVVSTFLGAHAFPREYSGDKGAYLDFLIDRVLPEVHEKKLAEFCDVFCEKNVYSIDQSRRLLARAMRLGLGLKIHADEMVPLGGAELAAELGAVSADHLLAASDNGIKRMAEKNVVATLLPATAFCLKEPYARARFMIDQGCAVALATDFNPGSSFTHSLPLVISLAVIYMGMSIEETITALTLNGAAAVNRESVVGSIDVGKWGDMVVMDCPSYPFLAYHTGVNQVHATIKKGNLVWQAQKGICYPT